MIDNISAAALSSVSASSAGATAPKTNDPAKLHEAAQQFESLLIGQLLKTSREAGSSGWLGTDDEDSGQTGVEFGEEQFARMMASSGGLGLSSMIESGLKTESAKGSTHDSN